MKFYLNGEERDFDCKSVADLVETLALTGKAVAVERNMEIVPKSLYGSTLLKESDKLEIVQFVAGG